MSPIEVKPNSLILGAHKYFKQKILSFSKINRSQTVLLSLNFSSTIKWVTFQHINMSGTNKFVNMSLGYVIFFFVFKGMCKIVNMFIGSF